MIWFEGEGAKTIVLLNASHGVPLRYACGAPPTTAATTAATAATAAATTTIDGGCDHNICARVVELASVELPPPHDGVPACLQVGHRPRALAVGRVGRLADAEAVA